MLYRASFRRIAYAHTKRTSVFDTYNICKHAIRISFLLEYEELANHVIRNNDHNLCNQLHQKAAPVQTVDEHKQHQFFHTEGQQASAEETGQLCPEALGRIGLRIKDPGLIRDELKRR